MPQGPRSGTMQTELPLSTTDTPRDVTLNRRLKHDRPGRSFLEVDGSRWGELILPSPDEASDRTDGALRVLAVTGFLYGTDVLNAVVDHERAHPGRSHLVAVATDDAIDSDAKIGLRRRMWKDYSRQERMAIEVETIETALRAGLPIYTGELKVEGFYRQLAEWRPDVIIMCGCGQILDAPIVAAPRYGVYNFHPSDLAGGHGAGAQFLEDNIARNDPWTRWTVHQVTEVVDGGPIVGQSPPIYLADAEGRIPADLKKPYEKFRPALQPMVTRLIDALAERVAAGNETRIERLAFDAHFPEDVRERLKQPIA